MSVVTSNRIWRTIVIGSAWLAAALLFLAFNPTGLSFWQSAAAVLASGVIAVGAVALIWMNPTI